MPQSDMLLPWKDAADNAAIALRLAGTDRSEARAPRPSEELDRLGLAGFAGVVPTRALGRDATAGRLRPDAARRHPGPAPRRAVRRPRRDHPGRAAGDLLAGPPRRGPDDAARHPRRRGGPLHGGPGRDPVPAAGTDHGDDRFAGDRRSGPAAGPGDQPPGVRRRARAGARGARREGSRHERAGRLEQVLAGGAARRRPDRPLAGRRRHGLPRRRPRPRLVPRPRSERDRAVALRGPEPAGGQRLGDVPRRCSPGSPRRSCSGSEPPSSCISRRSSSASPTRSSSPPRRSP